MKGALVAREDLEGTTPITSVLSTTLGEDQRMTPA